MAARAVAIPARPRDKARRAIRSATRGTNETIWQRDPDDVDLHRHLLGIHGAATGERGHSQMWK
jgi:hypothetical protein